jgi:hypothetical protein
MCGDLYAGRAAPNGLADHPTGYSRLGPSRLLQQPVTPFFPHAATDTATTGRPPARTDAQAPVHRISGPASCSALATMDPIIRRAALCQDAIRAGHADAGQASDLLACGAVVCQPEHFGSLGPRGGLTALLFALGGCLGNALTLALQHDLALERRHGGRALQTVGVTSVAARRVFTRSA